MAGQAQEAQWQEELRRQQQHQQCPFEGHRPEQQPGTDLDRHQGHAHGCREIQDEAIKCRYCRRFLPGHEPPGVQQIAQPQGPMVGEGALRFSHSGDRYLLGYAPDHFGIPARDDLARLRAAGAVLVQGVTSTAEADAAAAAGVDALVVQSAAAGGH